MSFASSVSDIQEATKKVLSASISFPINEFVIQINSLKEIPFDVQTI